MNNKNLSFLGLRSNDLGTNPYLTFALSAVVELICSIFTFQALKFSIRRKVYVLFMIISGTCCTLIYFSSKFNLINSILVHFIIIWFNYKKKKTGNVIITVVTALIAKFSISFTYAVIRMYSSEIFQDHDRKAYLAKCSIMARVGSVLAPFQIGLVCFLFY